MSYSSSRKQIALLIALASLGGLACSDSGEPGATGSGSGSTGATGSGTGTGTGGGGSTGAGVGGSATGGTTGGTSAGGTATGGAGGTTGGSAGTGGTGGVVLGECDPYTFPAYTPDINYDFSNDYPNVNPDNFEVYLGCDESEVAGYTSSGWYTFIWGHDRNPSITQAHIDAVLEELNADMAFARDEMGWPPDKLQQEGYYGNIYLYGSGLCTDNANNTATGGWQSGINGYPMVLISWYPVVNADHGGITHETIHAIMASMPERKAHWFNEGGNTWLQMNMEAQRSGQYGVGFLDGGPFLAPHVPIECYSGWLQDGSFGGPDAEGVNQTGGNGQISTWRDYLGGFQYNSVFSHFLALYVSPGANAWLWHNGEHINVLEELEAGIGLEQTQRAIMEYRARQALVDFGPWTDAFMGPIDDNWGRTIGAEEIAGGIDVEPPPHDLTFYAATTNNAGVLTPEPLTLPGWSGANQIPLTVDGNEVRVEFEPLSDNMRMQLVYRADDGTAVYGQPVTTGASCLRLDKAPQDGTVIAVVSNVDHVFEGEATRTAKHDYRIHLVSGVSGTADINEQHF